MADTTNKPLTHTPFAALSSVRPSCTTQNAVSPAVVRRDKSAPRSRSTKVTIHLESKGSSGAVVTRICGLPSDNLPAVASCLSRALGCQATIDNADILLQGSLLERAEQWLDRAGDLRAIQHPSPDRPSTSFAPTSAPTPSSTLLGTRRSDIRRGRKVAVVQKCDQDTGKLTEGVVRDVLTPGASHPRGIKVRLESGEVGRVQIAYEDK